MKLLKNEDPNSMATEDANMYVWEAWVYDFLKWYFVVV